MSESDSPYIFNVTQDDFGSVVLENSNRVPVLVDFWAAWCGPCQMLMPMLAKLVEEYGGQFLLAKVNTDEQQALAARYGVRSLPTVKLFKGGQVLDEFMGVQPESVVRAMLERHIVRESDVIRAEALQRYEEGDREGAMELLQKAAEMDPTNHKVRIDLAGLLAQSGRADLSEAMLQELPPDLRDSTEVKGLLARLRFARLAQDAPEVAELERRIERDPGDLEARYQLAARKIGAGDYEPGMEQLLEILRRDRGFEQDAGREGLLATFEILGGSGELVTRYRRQLFNLMH